MELIYIAGKITGIERERAKHHFDAAERYLRDEGFMVLNPMMLPEGLDYESYMHIDRAMVEVCDAVYMLNNWQDSPGAREERRLAECWDKEVLYE